MKRFVLAGLLAIAIVPAEAQWREAYPVLRIGVVGGDNLVLARTRAEPLRSYLENTLGVSVEVLAARDYGTLISDQLTGRFHATFLSAAAFVAASAVCSGCVQPLAVPTTSNGERGYRAALIVWGDSTIAEPGDLRERRIAVSAEDSLAGRLLPLALFQSGGLDLTTITIVERTNPAEAVLTLAGILALVGDEVDPDGVVVTDADAALGWIGLDDNPALRGVLAQLAQSGEIIIGDYTIVWTSPIIPHGPLTVLASLPSDLKADLAEAMVLMPGTDQSALAVVSGGLGGGFVPIEADDFAPLIILTDPAFGSPR